MKIKAVLFDKDDTLLDLSAFWWEPAKKLAAFIARSVDRERDLALIAQLEEAVGFSGNVLLPESPVVAGTNRDILLACARTLLIHRGTTEDEGFWAECERYLEYACVRYGEVRETADLKALFARLRGLGLKLGVVTSDSFAPTMHALKKVGVADGLDMILTADRVEHPKPAEDMARLFFENCGVSAAETVMVGDSANDLRFAQNSGMAFVLFRPAGDGSEIAAQHKITSLTELTADFLAAL